MGSAEKILQKLTTLVLISAVLPILPGGMTSNSYATEVTSDSVEMAVTRLPAFMAQLTDELAVLPGASVAIVHKDETIFSGGFGVTDIENKTTFTATTPTYIASGSKAFLGLVITSMAQEGEVDLHAPVGTSYLSDLDQEKLGAFGHVTLHELLTHTHGINGDAVSFRTAYTGDMTAENFWRIVGQLPPEENGKAFDYSNFGYVAAGYVVQHKLGLPWQDIVDQHVFEKLGMHQSTARVSDLVEQIIAKPHIWYGETRRIPLYKRDASMHAAGGHFSTAVDMSRWLIANMNEGRIDGIQIIDPNAIDAIQAPHANLDKSFFTYDRHAHGYGWYNAHYGGQSLRHHFGSFAGYRAHISFMPGHDLGVIVLSNDLSRPTLTLPDLIANFIYDNALGKAGTEQFYAEKLTEIDKLISPIRGKEMPGRAVNAPEDITPFVGDFVHPTWGVVSFLIRDDALVMRWGQAENAPTWTVREGTPYLRVEIAGSGYLLKPTLSDGGQMTAFTFSDVRFTRQ